LVEVDGFLMFSCLGPDTLRQLRAVYATQGWPAPCHAFTDMHDWGDMLVRAGFAEPVMDMERITLSFSSGLNLLAELRGLGRNLHLDRFPAFRGRAWRERLCATLEEGLAAPSESGRLALTFEVIYGHAFKPKPKNALKVGPQTAFSLEEMRETLARGRK
jgi:malonyl-CoA O-methyltransferase